MPMADRRTLVVVRHAKSDWPRGVADDERPLADRGRRDAPAIGRWLAGHMGRVDLVVCSPATRARQTWQLASAELEPKPPVREDHRVYGAGPARLLSVLAELPDEVSSVVLVGHNPGLADLVELICGETRELKTSAVAVLRWPGSWADAEFAPATLDDFTTARG
jgi:phosphohistidine phosphatase